MCRELLGTLNDTVSLDFLVSDGGDILHHQEHSIWLFNYLTTMWWETDLVNKELIVVRSIYR